MYAISNTGTRLALILSCKTIKRGKMIFVIAIGLPAKSDSYVMICLQSYKGLDSIDHRIGLIHK